MADFIKCDVTAFIKLCAMLPLLLERHRVDPGRSEAVVRLKIIEYPFTVLDLLPYLAFFGPTFFGESEGLGRPLELNGQKRISGSQSFIRQIGLVPPGRAFVGNNL